MRYKTIMADPPWAEIGGGKIKRGADRHYPLMKSKDIINMSGMVKELADPNGCHLYLWVTNNFLPVGLEVMQAWGFRYITIITWYKDRMGLGQYFRGNSESCLFGVMGKLPFKIVDGKRQQGKTCFQAPRSEHSRKPEEMRRMIEKVSYPPYLELFARESTERVFDSLFCTEAEWHYWGNMVEVTEAVAGAIQGVPEEHKALVLPTGAFKGGSNED